MPATRFDMINQASQIRIATALEKIAVALETRGTLDEVRESAAKLCRSWATFAVCTKCRKIAAIIFKDFATIDGTDAHWSGNADEHAVICEDCGP